MSQAPMSPRAIGRLLALTLATACSDTLPTSSKPTPAGPADPPFAVGVSNPTPAAAQPTAEEAPTYVFLAPGTVPGGQWARIENQRTGATAQAAMLDGGFDPVSLPARAGDTLLVTLGTTAGQTSRFMRAVPPRRPPIIVRTAPTRGGTDVPLNAYLRVVFSEPVTTSSISTRTIHLLAGGVEVPGRVQLSADGLNAWFYPAAPLTPGASYVLRIEASITDLDGDRLESASAVDFQAGSTTSIEKAPMASGDNQTDTVRATLAAPLRVRVLRGGAPAAGIGVTWSVEAAGGSVSAVTTITDAEGIASVTRVLGDTASEGFAHRGRTLARVDGAAGSPVVFSATVLPGQPTRLTSHPYDTAGIGAVNTVGGDNQELGHIRARVHDSYGNAVTGVRIVWKVTAGGGSITPIGPDTTGNTGNAGSAWAQFTLGPDEGEHIATATAPDVRGAPEVRYRRTAVAALVQVGNVNDLGLYTADFSPDSVAVPAGGTVGFLWGHTDVAPNVHNVTFDDDPTQPTSSPTMGNAEGGEIFMRTFTGGPGAIVFRCTVHGETGKVTVLP